MIADRSCFGNDPQGSDPQNPTEPQESQETPNSEQNGSFGTENGTSGTESGSPDLESGPNQRMNGSVSSQIPIPPGNIAVVGPSGYRNFKAAHGGQQWDYSQNPNEWNSNQNNSKTYNFLNIGLVRTKMFQNSRYFNDSKVSVHKVTQISISCLILQNYQEFFLLGILV